MIAEGTFDSCASLLLFQEHLAQLELGKHVKLESLGGDRVGIFVKIPVAADLFRASLTDGTLHAWGWGKYIQLCTNTA